jgi:hypothetical protein
MDGAGTFLGSGILRRGPCDRQSRGARLAGLRADSAHLYIDALHRPLPRGLFCAYHIDIYRIYPFLSYQAIPGPPRSYRPVPWRSFQALFVNSYGASGLANAPWRGGHAAAKNCDKRLTLRRKMAGNRPLAVDRESEGDRLRAPHPAGSDALKRACLRTGASVFLKASRPALLPKQDLQIIGQK